MSPEYATKTLLKLQPFFSLEKQVLSPNEKLGTRVSHQPQPWEEGPFLFPSSRDSIYITWKAPEKEVHGDSAKDMIGREGP